MMKAWVLIAVLLGMVIAEPSDDKIVGIPGYPANFNNRAFGGYLETSSPLRSLHYIFVECDVGVNNSAPVVLWLNGGPGCSSIIGFLQEISPYVLPEGEDYSQNAKTNLTPNPYHWLAKANLLFIDAPAGVGYSINQDPKYEHNDENTAKDNMDALKHFFTRKFPEYADNFFYMAGESYAGRMIPDLAMKVLGYNQNQPPKPIKLKGILLANPVLSMDNSLQESRVEFMISHNLVDPRLIPYWERSCKTDPSSAGCAYFYRRYEDLVYRIAEFNIYGQCYGRQAQRALLAALALKKSSFLPHSRHYDPETNSLKAGQWCSYDVGVESYLFFAASNLRSTKTQSPITKCNMTIFNNFKFEGRDSSVIIPKLLQAQLKVFIVSGDWDDVVPFTDTIRNINRMGVKLLATPVPWVKNEQHLGFIRSYSFGLKLYQVKGAGHQVPMYQRKRALHVFEDFLLA